LEADLGEDADMGFAHFMSSIDCMIMGRKTMEIISEMNLTSEQWPYGDTSIFVLSNTLSTPPKNMEGRIELYAGEIEHLVAQLESKDLQHAYVDGGTTIQSFLNRKLIDEMTISRAPILLGQGIPLFNNLNTEIKLYNCNAKAFPNDFIQEYYSVSYT